MALTRGGGGSSRGSAHVAVIVLVGCLAFGPTFAYAVSPNATEGSDSGDPGRSAYAAGRFMDALRIWRSRAEQGDARAAFGLGLLYDLGEGVGQDAAAAYNWYRRAAEAGHVLAEFNLGVMCDSGIGTGRNASEAALWYARAAAHGFARAEYNLAQLYQVGDGVPRNLDMAERWYAAAAGHGLSAAALKLATLGEEKRRATVSPAAANLALTPAALSGPGVASATGEAESVQTELSWAAPPQPVPVDFYVQVLALGSGGARRVFTSFSKESAVLVSLPRAPADYAWRVYTVAASARDYVPSAWSYFSTH